MLGEVGYEVGGGWRQASLAVRRFSGDVADCVEGTGVNGAHESNMM